LATAFSKSKVMPRGIYIAPDERRLVSRFWQSASGFWRGPSLEKIGRAGTLIERDSLKPLDPDPDQVAVRRRGVWQEH